MCSCGQRQHDPENGDALTDEIHRSHHGTENERSTQLSPVRLDAGGEARGEQHHADESDPPGERWASLLERLEAANGLARRQLARHDVLLQLLEVGNLVEPLQRWLGVNDVAPLAAVRMGGDHDETFHHGQRLDIHAVGPADVTQLEMEVEGALGAVPQQEFAHHPDESIDVVCAGDGLRRSSHRLPLHRWIISLTAPTDRLLPGVGSTS
jgi:hypothetical protein